MCGIAGYFGQGNLEILQNMTRALRHRGPDDEGFYAVQKIGLGQRRLSIIDLSPAGHQPMSNEDGTVWIVFNGEVYNYKRIAEKLTQKHVFRSSSDTEIILHMYEEIGEKVFGLLEGMFAIALYDSKNETLFLARDRMGKKPLYYGLFDAVLIFSSELKALHEHPMFHKKLNKYALKSYLCQESVATPQTIFENVFKLEPATYLKCQNGKIEKIEFWQLDFSRGGGGILSMEEALERLDIAINESVKDRLISDAHLGVLLSGGLDSSAVCYYAQKNSMDKIKTFSIGFKEASFDESRHARAVAEHLGTEHREAILSANDSLSIIDKLGEMIDEPMADQSILPTYLLSKFTRENVTVALGGDGGDEIFAGYVTFVAHRLAGVYEKIPLKIRKNIIEKMMLNLPTSHSYISLDFKIKSFINGFYGNKLYRDARWMGAFDFQKESGLFADGVAEEMKAINEYWAIDAYADNFSAIDISAGFQEYFKMLTVLCLRIYMMDQVMVKVDRASMANSLETRAPFLDTRVVDLALSLPLNCKLHPAGTPYGFETKYVLRKLMQDKLPHDIVWRSKKGFGVPMAEWLNGPLKPLLHEKLAKERIEQQGLFNYAYIDKIIKEHESKTRDNRKKLWTLLVFQIWAERWFN